jgi:hypothetical protein
MHDQPIITVVLSVDAAGFINASLILLLGYRRRQATDLIAMPRFCVSSMADTHPRLMASAFPPAWIEVASEGLQKVA